MMFQSIKKIGIVMLLVMGLSGCQKEEKKPEDDVVKVEPYTKGKVDGNHYESFWLNMQADFSDEIYMASEEEILQAQNAGAKTLYEEDKQSMLEEASSNGTVTFEMAATYLSGNPNCSLAVEKLPLSSITEKQYLDLTKKNLLGGINEQVKIVISGKMPEIQIAGETFKGIICTFNVNGEKFKSETYVRMKDGYAIVLNVTYDESTEELKNQLLETFKPLN